MHRAITLLVVVVSFLSTYGSPERVAATVSSLWTDQFCAGDGTVSIRLTWGPLDSYATDQWLDIAWYDPVIGADLQQTSKPFSAGANSINWNGLTPDITYYARVTQRFALASNLVSASPTFSFKTAPCSSTQPGEIVSIGTNPASSESATPAPATTVKPPVTPKPSATPVKPPVAAEPPSSSENCDRKSYPDVCIPPYPPDLDCEDIPMKNFKVRPPDPHGFDDDGDGIGCEASTPPGFPTTPPQLPTLR